MRKIIVAGVFLILVAPALAQVPELGGRSDECSTFRQKGWHCGFWDHCRFAFAEGLENDLGLGQGLEGLTGFPVTIVLNSEAQKAGLTERQLRADVELRLRKAAVGVLETGPVLSVEVTALDAYDVFIVYDIRVFVTRTMIFVCMPSRLALAKVWDTGVFGAVAPSRMVRVVRDAVAALVDQFLNDYLSVNPRQPSQ